jgi:predicted PurR-regulated permease PerM
MAEKNKVEITTKTIFKTIVILLSLWFIYVIRDVLALLFISLIIFSVIEPIVDWLQKKKIPRSAGILIVYLVLLLLISLLTSFLIPSIIDQFNEFSKKVPEYIISLNDYFHDFNFFFQNQHIDFGTQQIFEQLGSRLTAFSQGILSTTVGIFSGFISVIVVLSLVFYMTVREEGIKNLVVFLTPDPHKNYAAEIVLKIKNRMGKWMQGQLLLMFIVFILDYIGLTLAGVPFALTLAIFAGIMEIIPFIGPIISAIPGIILGLTISPLVGVIAGLIYFLVQQFESNIILPQVMKKAVGLNPIVVILALLVGAKLGGILGMILSVPTATIINVFVEDIFKDRA